MQYKILQRTPKKRHLKLLFLPQNEVQQIYVHYMTVACMKELYAKGTVQHILIISPDYKAGMSKMTSPY